MTSTPKSSIAAEAPAGVESWENEGGHLPSRRSASIAPSNVSLVARDQTTESDALAAMRARFLADFAGGSMGQHHNTYRHRARVLDQLTEAQRIGDAGQPPR